MERAIDAEKYMELLKEQYLHYKAMKHGEAARAWQGAMQLLYDMPTLTPPNEWVSVEERLPEPTYCVLVYTTDYSIEVDALDSDGEWMSYEVTHWMPLPAPPEKE